MNKDSIASLIVALQNEARSYIDNKFTKLETKIMAQFSEVMQAISDNGTAIAAVLSEVNAASALIQTALESAKAGTLSPAMADQAIATLNEQKALLGQAKDTVAMMIPTVPSPKTSTDPSTPIPVPASSSPVSPDPVVVTPPASGVGLPGSSSVDVGTPTTTTATPVPATTTPTPDSTTPVPTTTTSFG